MLNFGFIYLFLALLGLCCCAGFSLVVESEGAHLVSVHALLIGVASLCCGIQAAGGLSSHGFQALELRFSSCGVWA